MKVLFEDLPQTVGQHHSMWVLEAGRGSVSMFRPLSLKTSKETVQYLCQRGVGVDSHGVAAHGDDTLLVLSQLVRVEKQVRLSVCEG